MLQVAGSVLGQALHQGAASACLARVQRLKRESPRESRGDSKLKPWLLLPVPIPQAVSPPGHLLILPALDTTGEHSLRVQRALGLESESWVQIPALPLSLAL